MNESTLVTCPLCQGSGHNAPNDGDCFLCCGTSTITQAKCDEYAEAHYQSHQPTPFMVDCPCCSGSGLNTVQDSTCPMCVGHGAVTPEEHDEFDTHMS